MAITHLGLLSRILLMLLAFRNPRLKGSFLKPVVVEEFFPLKCGVVELEGFMRRAEAAGLVQGWVSFYWGKRAEEYAEEEGIGAAIKAQWLQRFAEMGAGR